MASLAGALGEDTRAARLRGAAEAAREATGIVLATRRAGTARAPSEPQPVPGSGRQWEEALDEGRAMSLDEAARYALSGRGSAGPTGPSADEPTGNLTRREREVAVLVARGLTNREISTRARHLRAHRRQPRRTHPPQAGPPFPGPDAVQPRRSTPTSDTNPASPAFPSAVHWRVLRPVAKWARAKQGNTMCPRADFKA